MVPHVMAGAKPEAKKAKKKRQTAPFRARARRLGAALRLFEGQIFQALGLGWDVDE
jgi:hypothetical protein